MACLRLPRLPASQPRDHRGPDAHLNEPIDERVLPTVEGPEERAIASPELVEALATLSDRDREVVALRFGADLSGPEIARMLDLSLANVQQILSRSLRKLRTLLENTEPYEVDTGERA